jgi:hypothetical protein
MRTTKPGAQDARPPEGETANPVSGAGRPLTARLRPAQRMECDETAKENEDKTRARGSDSEISRGSKGKRLTK